MLLEVRDLHAGYGALDVLRGVSLEVAAGELVAVLGANGAGKSTLLRTISRYDTNVRSGSIVFDGNDLLRASTERVVRLGCLQVPEGRQLFTELSVDDNIRLGAYATSRRTLAADVDAVYARFPRLAERRAQLAFSLSGGEQQMLAIGRALMAKPKLLMLDEPSTGLAPQIVAQIFDIIGDLKAAGTAILLVEQNAFLTLRAADRAYIMENGAIALAGPARELANDERVRAIYLGGTVDEA
jgi:branched-chain amino acid transport system ATP-binding protein